MDDGDTRKGNFGIRGAHSRRSRKISVYEDYNPLNFAPYTDPTTHYIPPDERIGGIEVIKGSGQLTHGPQTKLGIRQYWYRATNNEWQIVGEFSIPPNG